MASPLAGQEFQETMVSRPDLSSNMLVLTRKMMADTISGLVDVDLFVRRPRRIESVIAYHRDIVVSVVPKE